MLFDKINNGSPFGVIREVFSFYCENKQDKNMHNMKNIKLLSTGRHDFGKDLDSIDVELSNPNTFVQSLFTLPPLQTTVEIEEHRKNTTFDQNYNSLYYRQSSAQNIKINEIISDALIECC